MNRTASLDIQDILNSTNLPALSASDPELWGDVFADIKERVSSGQAATLGPLRATHTKILEQWRGASASPLGATQHARTTVLRSRMTVLAIDQFADAMTGKIGKQPSLKDRLVFAAITGRMLANQLVFTCEEFDRSWAWMGDKIWAASEIQRRGYWSVPTKELALRIKEHAAGRPVLELGAGLGYLATAMTKTGTSVNACDDMSWQTPASAQKPAALVTRLDAATALKTLKPSFVICSWPPPGNDFEEKIFQTTSVQCYIALVSQHRFASGNWLAYQRQTQFTCSTSGVFNNLLRPLEAEQQALIFRRRS